MASVKLTYTRTQVNKAGDILTAEATDPNVQAWAFDVLSKWRSAHSYPVNTFQATLRQKLSTLGYKALVAQRLKRTPSIVGKLKRIQKMKLSRMQDIGGLRAVVQNLKEVEKLRDSYIHSRFEHELVKENDYIKEPKRSGYRSIHLIYSYYRCNPPDYNGLLLELQIRTRMQHAWATAVETTGAIFDQALKASEGPKRWLDFFAIVSSAFAYLEDAPRVPQYVNLSKEETFSAVVKCEKSLDARVTLGNLTTAVNFLQRQRTKEKAYYYLLTLDISSRSIGIKSFTRKELKKATDDYLAAEKLLADGRNSQVVLVSASSIDALKKAYPNYFLNTHQFLAYLGRVINWDKKPSEVGTIISS